MSSVKRPAWLAVPRKPTPKPEEKPAIMPLPPPEPGSNAPGRTVVFYPQGYYYTSDIRGNNIPSECGDWYVAVLRDQIRRGVIDNHTRVQIPAVYFGPLGTLRQAKYPLLEP